LLTSSWGAYPLEATWSKLPKSICTVPTLLTVLCRVLFWLWRATGERLGQRVIEYCSRRRDDFPARLKTGGPRLVEVRVTKIGADFSGHGESRVDRD